MKLLHDEIFVLAQMHRGQHINIYPSNHFRLSRTNEELDAAIVQSLFQRKFIARLRPGNYDLTSLGLQYAAFAAMDSGVAKIQ